MSATVWTPGTKILLNANNLVYPQTFVMTVGQTIINITEFSYTKNTNSIIVFKDGKLILNVEDYAESTDTQIILLTPAAGGEEITILGFVGIEGTPSIADGRLSVSNTDLTLGYLRDKLIAGNGVTLTRINVGLNDQLVIDVTFPVSILPDGSVPMDAPLILADGSRAVSLAELNNVAGTVPKRQVILAAKNTNGINSALKISSTALQVDLDASTTEPYILTYANGFNARGQVNTIEEFQANQLTVLPTPVPAYTRSYLYKDYQGNFGHTKLQTHYGPSYNRRNSALLHFDGPNNSTVIIDAYGKTWAVSGAAELTNTMYKFGSSSLSLDGTANCGVRTTELSGISKGQSWTVSMWVRLNALPANAALVTLVNMGLSNTYGIFLSVTTTSSTTKISLHLSSNGTSWNIANNVLGTDTTWAVNVFRHVELTYNAQEGKYYVFVDGVKDIEVTSALEVITGDITCLGTVISGIYSLNGYIDEFSYEPYCRHRSAFTPPLVPYSAEGYWFDTTSYLYKHIIAENTTVGGFPTFEVINRIELAEVTTDGTSITALNNYAILGEYMHVTPLISGSGVISFNHNLGVSVGHVEAELRGRNKIPAAGYMPGMETTLLSYGSNLLFLAAPIVTSRVLGEYKTGGTSYFTYVQNRTTGNYEGIGTTAASAAMWDVVITVRRKF